MTDVTLENQHLRAVLDPDEGVGVRAFSALVDSAWLPLMPDARDPDCDLKFSSFHMIPYSNRIADGVFAFAGRQYQLLRGDQHAIHGDTRQRPWKIAEQTGTRIRCTFDAADHDPVNWPWPFTAELEYALEEAMLTSRLALWNRGETDMPAGFGWHPYFSRTLTAVSEPVHLCFRAAAAYPDDDDNRIPSGPPRPLAGHQDFSSEKELTPDNFLDTCLRGYDGDGYIAWPESGLRLRFSCSPECTHLVLYNPAGKPYFAAEPVTNANDGVNLLARGDEGCGTVILAPDAALAASFSLHPERC